MDWAADTPRCLPGSRSGSIPASVSHSVPIALDDDEQLFMGTQHQHLSNAGDDDSINCPSDHTYQFIFNIDHSIPIARQPESARQSLVCDWSRHIPALGGTQLTRLEHDKLIDRYFKYSNSWFMNVVPMPFLRDMVQSLVHPYDTSQAEFYSPLLHCSILAFAMAFSDDPLLRRRITREILAKRAKQLLNETIERPNLCLIQALSLLSEFHCGFGEQDQGYMYMEMSIHALRTVSSNQQGLQTRPQLEKVVLNNWCLWSMYFQDKMMAVEANRNYVMTFAKHTPPLPRVRSCTGSYPWNDPDNTRRLLASDQDNRLASVFSEGCKLMRIAEAIICVRHLNPFEARLLEDVLIHKTRSNLENWMRELPPELSISSDSFSMFPHVITLNITYWWLVLLFHQPFHHPAAENNTTADPAYRPFGDLSNTLCDRAAREIMILVELYRRWYGLRVYPRYLILAIYTAGTLFVKQRTAVPKEIVAENVSAFGAVEECIATLHTIAETWGCASKYEAQLLALVQEYDSHESFASGVEADLAWVGGLEGRNDSDGRLNACYCMLHYLGMDPKVAAALEKHCSCQKET